jgi:hypothetical protein
MPVVKIYQKVGERAAAASAEPAPRLARLLEEIIEWKKRVNLKLQQAANDRVTREFLQELLLEIKASRQSPSSSESSRESSGISPSVSPSTLQLRTTGQHALAVYSIPDRAGRVLDYVPPATLTDLYEPWTENDSGLWMRVQNGGWLQLWNRSTGTYFAE